MLFECDQMSLFLISWFYNQPQHPWSTKDLQAAEGGPSKSVFESLVCILYTGVAGSIEEKEME